MKNVTAILLIGLWSLASAPAAHASDRVSKFAQMLEIIDGDTDFVVDPQAGKAWWVKGTCKVAIPVQKSKVSQKNNKKTISSEKILDRVRLGGRQVTLEQQFRFELATDGKSPAKAEIYNSLRGGWSPVPVRVRANCSLDASCRTRMDVPIC